MNTDTLKQFRNEYLSSISLPAHKPAKQFILGLIGLIGSGKTTFGRLLIKALPGTVLVDPNGARFLLKKRNLPWGDNVWEILDGVVGELLVMGYGVVLTGSTAEARDRDRLQSLANERGVRLWFVRIMTDTAIARERKRSEYDDPSWTESTFDHLRVNTVEKMIENIDARKQIHDELNSSDIDGLMGDIDNNGTLEELKKRTVEIAEKVAELSGAL